MDFRCEFVQILSFRHVFRGLFQHLSNNRYITGKVIFNQNSCFFNALYHSNKVIFILWDRLYIVYKPLNVNERPLSPIYFAIGVCIILSLMWATLPLVGWSHYTFEGLGTSCCIEWSEKTFNVQTYNVAMLVFIFLLPLACIIATTSMSIVCVSSTNI